MRDESWARGGLQLWMTCALLAIPGGWAADERPPEPAEQEDGVKVFEGPEEAFRGYGSAAASGDVKEVAAIVGPAWAQVLTENHLLGQDNTTNWMLRSQVFLIGYERLPCEVKYDAQKTHATIRVPQVNGNLPMPLAKKPKGWIFDQDPARLKAFLPTLHRRVCEWNLQQFYQAVVQGVFRNGQSGRLPRGLEAVNVQAKALLCPAVADNAHGPGSSRNSQCDYLYIGGQRYNQARFNRPGGPVLAFDRKGNHPGGRNVLRGNGQIEWFTDEAKFRTQVQDTLKVANISLELPPPGSPRELTPEETQRFQQAIQDLGCEDYPKREAATETLAKCGEPVRKLLEENRNSADPEILQRCRDLLEEFNFRQQNRGWVVEMRKELGLDEVQKPPAKGKK